MLFHTTCSEYFKENVHIFDALDFLAELTQHVSPKGVQLIRRYGLYASRTKGRWIDIPYLVEHTPAGWRVTHTGSGESAHELGFEPLSEIAEVEPSMCKQAWAPLLAKLYEVDPPICPKCGSQMKAIAVIQDRQEIRNILRHLVKIGRSPPGFDQASL